MRFAVAFALAALLTSCGGHASSDEEQPPAPPHAADTVVAPEHTVVAPPTGPALPPGDRRLDARGIVVTRHADGTISVVGDDRWGGHIDSTYADGHYFKYAVDTLARSVTDPQAAALRETVPELAPEAMNDTTPPVSAATHDEHR